MWHYYDDEHSSIIASSLYRKTEDAYESGQVLHAKDYPNYFAALSGENIIATDDAVADPCTCEFKESYLKPLGITSIMDVPIRVKGETIGVICIEHTGEIRHWDLNEQDFITSVSISLELALESFERIMSEARQKTILETMIDGLITIDDAGIIESFNPAAEKMFGYSSTEIIGRNVNLLMPNPHHSQHQEYINRYRKTGEAHILGITGIEVEGIRKNGSTLPIAISLSEMSIGEKHLFSAAIRDITEKKQIELEREESAAERAQLIDAVNVPLFGIDTQGYINEWNQTAVKIFNYSKDDIMGHNWVAEFISDEYKKPVKEILDNALKGNEIANYEFPLYSKEGKRIDILLNATTRRDFDGNITGVIGVGQDITELRIKEKALNQIHRMEAVGQLTGGIAHDFNNLLSIIGGNLRFLQQDIGKVSVKINELFEDAMSAVNEGSELIQHLLTFSSQRKLISKNKNANEIIKSFTRFLSRTLGGNIELDVDLPDQNFVINIDQSQLENALLNLAINARDAMQNGGRITIKTRRYHHVIEDNSGLTLPEGDYILISVSDTGSGIGSEVLQHVFEPFLQPRMWIKGRGWD